ncbi:MAG: O-antigen ligase family protein [Gammaproteobacteria bacterium]|nr:O-antigen ligase family protein [Gammaproteobacteria bacterium]
MTLIRRENLALVIVGSLGLYLFVTSAFFALDFLSVFDAKRIIQLAVFSFILLFAVAWPPLRRATVEQLNRLTTLQRVCLAVFFCIGIISSLRLDYPAYALVDVSMMYVLMILIAIVAASRSLAGERFDRWAIVLLVAMGFAVAFQELTGFAAGWAFGAEFSYEQALIHFAHPRFYNQLQTWSIPVIAALPLFYPANRWVKVVCALLLGLQWFIVISMAARGTVVSLVTAMVFIALWMPSHRKYWVKYQVLGVLTGIALYSSILFLNGLLIPKAQTGGVQTGEFYSHSVGRPMVHTSGRSVMWRFAIEDGMNHPALGTGPTLYACDRNIILPAHPHNFLLRIFAEWGAIAALMVFILAISIGIHFLRNLKTEGTRCQTGPPLRAILATSLIAGILHACLSGLLIMPASQVALVLIGGWVVSLTEKSVPRKRQESIMHVVLFAGTLFVLAQSTFAITELRTLPVRTSYSADYGTMMPRFWQDGRVCEYVYSPSIPAE